MILNGLNGNMKNVEKSRFHKENLLLKWFVQWFLGFPFQVNKQRNVLWNQIYRPQYLVTYGKKDLRIKLISRSPEMKIKF